jgi:hypothetical protein
MVKPVVFNTFHIVGSGLWMLWGITLKVYEYANFKLLLRVVISDR